MFTDRINNLRRYDVIKGAIGTLCMRIVFCALPYFELILKFDR